MRLCFSYIRSSSEYTSTLREKNNKIPNISEIKLCLVLNITYFFFQYKNAIKTQARQKAAGVGTHKKCQLKTAGPFLWSNPTTDDADLQNLRTSALTSHKKPPKYNRYAQRQLLHFFLKLAKPYTKHWSQASKCMEYRNFIVSSVENF